ncbi:CLUMA_CG002115, isoform A [Clunio marinus]|uniref:Ferritin n=1 Tax=Clunio marinus TaxID=568069 RepID=A0A1J1HJU8_9DIPT|nr:CLUMA_CG002115, isoform A [Clunio marinus]
MNKFGLLVAVTAICSLSSVLAETCTRDANSLFRGIDFVDMRDECVTETEEQIKKEITASLKYLSMAAYFAKDSVNRPGFAKLFFDSASEEREHAYKLIEYLSMRGRYLRQKDKNSWKSTIPNFDISSLVKDSENLNVMGVTLSDLTPAADAKTTSGLIALQNALKLETAVTKSIRNLVVKCEGEPFNHYHFVDYLTAEFLEEQYKGQRDLAGKISTLGKMVQNQGAELADFLFDKQLL